MGKKGISMALLGTVLCFRIVVADSNIVTSSAENQIGVSVTIYNNDLGLVKDTREIALAKGDGELRFRDVASHIKPTTVYVTSLNYPKGFQVREQNYEYDLMNENKLLDKYVGKKIKIIDDNKYQDRKSIVEALLLSNNNGQIYKINNEIFLGHPGIKVLPEIPENLIAEPTLMWLYTNKAKVKEGKPHTLEVSYLTEQINWKADYIFVLGSDNNNKTDLSGWVTIDNRSGATYKNAGLKLVAGDVHRVSDGSKPPHTAVPKPTSTKSFGSPFSEKEFFEYHLYTLPGKTTIKNNQSKQIRLLEASGVKAEKELVVSSSSRALTYRNSDGKKKQPVNVYMVFRNARENRLGMPLPMGVVRVYKKDTDGSQIFIGEDRIDHTPKNEEVRLKVGHAFDVVAEKLQTDYIRASSKQHESEWEITIRNHKKKVINVTLFEKLQGNWAMLSNSHKYKKIDAFTLRFDVEVLPGKEEKVTYRVKVGL